MGKSDGITRSRSKVGETYKGFSIISVLAVHHWWNQWDRRYEMSRQYETKRETYYEFCKEGDENRPAQAYKVHPYPTTVEATKEAIDKMISGEVIYFTDAEREKYVYSPNRKCDWGYGYESLMKILKEHKKADKRMKLCWKIGLMMLISTMRQESFHRSITTSWRSISPTTTLSKRSLKYIPIQSQSPSKTQRD